MNPAIYIVGAVGLASTTAAVVEFVRQCKVAEPDWAALTLLLLIMAVSGFAVGCVAEVVLP